MASQIEFYCDLAGPYSYLAATQVPGQPPAVDVGRWTARYKVPFRRNPNLRDVDHAALGRGALVAIDQGRGADHVDAVFRAIWAGAQDLADTTVPAGLHDQAGFQSASLLDQAAGAEYVARLDRQTSEAAERGVFGLPTFFVHDQMFFGNDRLDFVIEAAKAVT